MSNYIELVLPKNDHYDKFPYTSIMNISETIYEEFMDEYNVLLSAAALLDFEIHSKWDSLEKNMSYYDTMYARGHRGYFLMVFYKDDNNRFLFDFAVDDSLNLLEVSIFKRTINHLGVQKDYYYNTDYEYEIVRSLREFKEVFANLKE